MLFLIPKRRSPSNSEKFSVPNYEPVPGEDEIDNHALLTSTNHEDTLLSSVAGCGDVGRYCVASSH